MTEVFNKAMLQISSCTVSSSHLCHFFFSLSHFCSSVVALSSCFASNRKLFFYSISLSFYISTIYSYCFFVPFALSPLFAYSQIPSNVISLIFITAQAIILFPVIIYQYHITHQFLCAAVLLTCVFLTL